MLGKEAQRFNWALHAYCLMSNPYHLRVATPDANLSRGMRQLNGVYTQTFNRTHDRVGHVFQGRYQAILVEKDIYLLELARDGGAHASYTKDNLRRNDDLLKIDADWMSHRGSWKRGLGWNGEW